MRIPFLRRLLVLVLVALAAGLGARASFAAHGGTYTASTGEQVLVLSSDGYLADDARNQGWAEFLTRLVHGEELATVTLYLAPPAELGQVCGFEALACYEQRRRTIYAAAEPLVPDVTAEAVIAHEYGHHISNSRTNAPWVAADWGTKRWATYTGICSRTTTGELAPGARNERYELSPGEAFSEVYRLLNERRLGLAETSWQVVDERFIPDERALRLVEQDVLEPWRASTTISRSGRVGAATTVVKVATPLDGRLTSTVRSTVPARFDLVVGGRVAATRFGRSASFGGDVCGSRTASIRIRATAGAGRYTLSLARP